MVLVALAMFAIIGMAALSIDIITLYLAREQAQRSADQAALAAARVISISGMTGDPNNSATWGLICGGAGSPASLAAIAVATQSEGGGTPTVTYSAGGAGSQDCSTVTGAFGVNPLVTVKITHSSLPTFFSRIWGNPGNSVSATATAEAFNPSASDINTDGGATGVVIPVQPSCVKPLMVPNQDPWNPSSACNTVGNPGCNPFVSLANGSIQSTGIRPTNPTGVIGESFTLVADCGPAAGSCKLATADPQPKANGTLEGAPSLEYVPGAAPPSSVAVPSCAAGNGNNAEFEPAVAGCDQSTIYQCGVQSSLAANPNQVDLSESPARPFPGDTANALACLMTNSTTLPLSGQDTLDTTAYPYKIIAGSANPLGAGINGSTITSSNSIISLPIYDPSTTIVDNGGTTSVTIVGFLQVFVNNISDTDGSLQVTVLNVAGCGNNASTSGGVTGTSPVPVRLVTPP